MKGKELRCPGSETTKRKAGKQVPGWPAALEGLVVVVPVVTAREGLRLTGRMRTDGAIWGWGGLQKQEAVSQNTDKTFQLHPSVIPRGGIRTC